MPALQLIKEERPPLAHDVIVMGSVASCEAKESSAVRLGLSVFR